MPRCPLPGFGALRAQPGGQDEMPDADDTTPPAEEPDCGQGGGCGGR
jgi:hypothetical protein